VKPGELDRLSDTTEQAELEAVEKAIDGV